MFKWLTENIGLVTALVGLIAAFIGAINIFAIFKLSSAAAVPSGNTRKPIGAGRTR